MVINPGIYHHCLERQRQTGASCDPSCGLHRHVGVSVFKESERVLERWLRVQIHLNSMARNSEPARTGNGTRMVPGTMMFFFENSVLMLKSSWKGIDWQAPRGTFKERKVL